MLHVVVSAFALLALVQPNAQQLARGRVFDDANRNGVFDPGEVGIANVRVSNQRLITKTDLRGRWMLPYDDDTIFFVIKPRGWKTAVDENQLPRFYYIHKPLGSPKLKFAGVEPTGPLPESIDFPLYKQNEPDRFSALFFGDTQPRDLREVEYIANDIVAPLMGNVREVFGVTLGDIVFDDLSVFEPLTQTIALLGIPWYNVLGNHDLNFDASDDRHSDETFERLFGPPYYSFDYGSVHFIVLDNVSWTGAVPEEKRSGYYKAALGSEQLEFLRNDLALVPKDQLVVLMMHIPITEIEERQNLYRLLETRPKAVSVSAHMHFQEHRFIGKEQGFNRQEPHHHVVTVTTSGSWWCGAPDEYGIPHTTMRDGAPNGYAVFTFDGNQYSIEFRAARAPATYQMNIIAPDAIDAGIGDVFVYVNVFGGSVKSKVEMKVGTKGLWTAMQQVSEPDPAYLRMVERDKTLTAPYRPLPGAMNSPHLWKLKFPPDLPKGVHAIHVRTTDIFGQTYTASKAIRVQ